MLHSLVLLFDCYSLVVQQVLGIYYSDLAEEWLKDVSFNNLIIIAFSSFWKKVNNICYVQNHQFFVC